MDAPLRRRLRLLGAGAAPCGVVFALWRLDFTFLSSTLAPAKARKCLPDPVIVRRFPETFFPRISRK